MGKPVRAALFVVAALTALASVTALAASGYSVGVSVPSPVTSGQSFSVKARGAAVQKALLYVYLDRRRCRSRWDREAQRVGQYKTGETYFRHIGGGPPREAFDYAWVSGSFRQSFTAYAGTTIGREHACVYLATPNKYGGYRVNAAHGSAMYTVTK